MAKEPIIYEANIEDFIDDPQNANRGTERGHYMIDKSVQETGLHRGVFADRNGVILGGNKTRQAAVDAGYTKAIVVETDGDTLVVTKRRDFDLSDPDNPARLAAYADNRTGQVNLDFDFDVIADDIEAGLNLGDFWFDWELEGLDEEPKKELPPNDAEPQTSRADELRELWGVELGQLWRLPSRVEGQEHLLICGDCTDPTVVGRVMGGDVADMIHADPPYGMGKEKDGIANDNLYREKLDAFQMAWWTAARPFVADNGSGYIWGNAEDLWRLWYCGGLRDSERLTFRNEVVWGKGSAGAGGISHIGAEGIRQYPNETERALFFMLGEQGFNNNADNYWEGWDSIVEYLDSQRRLMAWGIKDTKRIAGHSENSGCHWFDKSQWSMPTEEVYKAWQAAAVGDAFKRDYDDLKREFYATRAYFDNTHENMTDVWSYSRVTGDDRHEHATPKPVEMVARAIKSSCPDGGVVYAPFAGTLPEVIAAENLSRQCRAVELSPAYVAVILDRYERAFNIKPELVKGELVK